MNRLVQTTIRGIPAVILQMAGLVRRADDNKKDGRLGEPSLAPRAFLMWTLMFSVISLTLSAQARSVADGNTAFALEVYGNLKARPGNLFFSPYSISTALAMTYAGARGETEKEMGVVLHFGNQGQLSSGFGVLQRELNKASKQKGIELNIANALWAQEGHPFLPAFLKIAKDEYQANLNQVDFKTAGGTACDEINRWVAERTKDKIQGILAPGSLDAASRLVLVNAIYFKGIWEKQFNKSETSTQPFHVSPASQVQVPLMYRLDEVRYMGDAELQAVELPYQGGELSMVILLPRQMESCEALEKRLSPKLFAGVLGQMRAQKVELFMPRFKLESGLNLKDTLSRMGMVSAFGENADFSGMDASRQLYISAVFHKAWGEVNEEGTEAAAATAVGVATLGIHPAEQAPPVFRADHPFLFFIRETHSGSLLFIGRVANPSA